MRDDDIMVAGRDCYGTLESFSQIVIKEMHINPFSSPLREPQFVSPLQASSPEITMPRSCESSKSRGRACRCAGRGGA